MNAALWVAFGSALGGVGRYWCSGPIAHRIGETFPWGTLVVNVADSAAIGLVATLSAPEGRWLLSPEARQFLMLGIFGGFTTFSSFSLQTLNLVHDGEWPRALAYVLASVTLCLAGVWAGHGLAIVLNR